MARKEDDPTHSSSGEEEDGSSEEVSESESEPDKNPPSPTPAAKKKPSASSKLPVRPDIPAPAVSSSDDDDDESGSESESDSDLPPKISGKSDPAIKPIASKPMDNPPKAVTKPRSKPSASSSTAPAVKTGNIAKRSAPVQKSETTEAKKAKKKGVDTEDGSEGSKKANGDDPKKILFQRLWSEEDEVVILKGMSDYTAKYKADPIADMNGFHDFIKKSVHVVDVSKAQLADKVRRLKKKYVNNFTKEKSGKEKTGKERTFSNPHEQLCYNLSKKVWGSDVGEDAIVKVDAPKSSGTSKRYHIQRNGTVSAPSEVFVADEHKEVTAMEVDANVVQSIGPVLLGGSVPLCDSADQMIKNGWKLVVGPKRSEWEEKSKKLMVEEVEVYTKRLELMHEQAKLVSEALKSAQE